MSRTDRARLLTLAKKRGILTAHEVAEAGIHSQELTRLVAEGAIERVARGRYRATDRPLTEHHGLAIVAAAVPQGVVCLLSAASFHGLGTQLPSRVWIAIERGSRTPALTYPPLEVVRFSGAAFREGVESHVIERQKVRVYGVAKTLADLFKYRNRVGLDVAIEALREAWVDRRFTMDALDRAARACRVERVIQPYVEGVIG